MMASCTTSVHEFEYQWIIERFSLRLECAKEEGKKKIDLYSCLFSVDDKSNDKWRLQMIFYGPEHEHKGFVGFFTYFECFNNTSMVWAKQDIFFVDSESNKIKNGSANLHKFTFSTPDWGFRKLITTEKLLDKTNSYLPNDQLTIICRITVMDKSAVTVVPNPPTPTVEDNNVPEDYAKFFMNPKFSDMTFVLNDGQRIPAHKMILVTRSPTFATMFEDESEENDSNEWKIEDVDPDTFTKILQYIYTNAVPNLESKAIDLITATDKYGLAKLKELCVDYLYGNISINNAMQTLVLAERCNNQRLLAYTREFINARLKGENKSITTSTGSNSSLMNPN